MLSKIFIAGILLLRFVLPAFGQSLYPRGFQDASWGMNPNQVRDATGLRQWQNTGKETGFPQELPVAIFVGRTEIAGYPATVKYYFFKDRFFQATASFDFSRLTQYDFNYNVFRSVDGYYKAIRDQTLTFVDDIYALLTKKYGKKQPVFRGLDPRDMFQVLDLQVKREIWNLRYHPYEYYRKIVTSSYARWDFPKTSVIFSVNISARDKRFDYQLSAASLDLQREISAAVDSLRSSRL